MQNKVSSVSQLCRTLGMSRANAYLLISKGVLPKPKKLGNGRPYYDAESIAMAQRVRETGIGANGEFVIFYDRLPKEKPSVPKPEENHGELMESLKELGLKNLKKKQVIDAVNACFPDGIEEIDPNEVLRVVYKRLKCPETA